MTYSVIHSIATIIITFLLLGIFSICIFKLYERIKFKGIFGNIIEGIQSKEVTGEVSSSRSTSSTSKSSVGDDKESFESFYEVNEITYQLNSLNTTFRFFDYIYKPNFVKTRSS